MVSAFLYLPAFRNGCSESSDARHVGYPVAAIPVSSHLVAADVQRRQRPDGGNTISTKVGSGLYSHLLALGKEGSDDDGSRLVQLFAAEVCFGHPGVHGDRLLVAEGNGR